MNKYLALLVSCILLHFYTDAQSRKYKIAVIGSSTAAGMGASTPDSSWVNLTQTYYQNLGEIDNIYNIARSGLTTYDGMPTGFIPPTDPGNPVTPDFPNQSYNVTLALQDNPDVVLVNFPTNDVADNYSITETMFNLRTIYQTVINAGKICYICSTQPRSSVSVPQQQLLKVERDSILMEFGTYSLNFYNCIVAADSLNIKPIYNYDGTHVNDGGHQQLFQVVKNANILSAFNPLPLTLTGFTAIIVPQGIRLNWTAADEEGPVTFSVQRSKDGSTFDDLWQENVEGSISATNYSWTDQDPLSGKSFYRLKASDQGGDHFSPIVALGDAADSWGIGKIMTSAGASELMVEIFSPASQNSTVTITDAAGKRVRQQSVSLTAPSVTAPISLAGLANGEYFLRIVTDQGNVATKAFMKFQ
jgi:hypothetical protein